ncbi:hypothetical protein ABBQ38_011996 [Trebouxia sp. C0009 RCD-2024]
MGHRKLVLLLLLLSRRKYLVYASQPLLLTSTGRSMNLPEDWLQSLTKDDIAAACVEANYPALPKKALKEQWVAHASGHICLHHLNSHALEKLCKLQEIAEVKSKPKAQLIKLLQGPRKMLTAPAAVQLDVSSAFSTLSLAHPGSSSSSMNSTLVSPERLSVLVPQRLEDLCRARVLPTHGSKAELVGSLHQDKVSLEELSKPELKALCAAEALPVSGTCAMLIARLQASSSNTAAAMPSKQQAVQQQQLDRQKAVEQEGALLQSGKKMVRHPCEASSWRHCYGVYVTSLQLKGQ